MTVFSDHYSFFSDISHNFDTVSDNISLLSLLEFDIAASVSSDEGNDDFENLAILLIIVTHFLCCRKLINA